MSGDRPRTIAAIEADMVSISSLRLLRREPRYAAPMVSSGADERLKRYTNNAIREPHEMNNYAVTY